MMHPFLTLDDDTLETTAHLIMEFVREGGFDNASNF